MKEMHWNETDGIWYDYDLDSKVNVKSSDIFKILVLSLMKLNVK